MIYLRRIVGKSMLPGFKPNQVVFAITTKRPRVGAVVIVHHNGIEKIKRLAKIRKDAIYILGDNPAASTDSRTLGWLPKTALKAKIIWPQG